MNTPIPENIRRCMSAKDLAELGQEKPMPELEMHSKYAGFCRGHRLGIYHADPTRPATIEPGTPDFGVYRESRILWVEFKAGTNELSPVQKAKIAAMVADKNVVFVCRSLQEAQEVTRKFFHLKI